MAEKKKHRAPVALFIILGILLTAAGIFAVTAFLYPGFLKGKRLRKVEQVTTRPTEYDGQNSTQAIMDYADRLEEAGNTEAAEKVRNLVPKAAQGEAVYEAKTVEELEAVRESEELNTMIGGRRKNQNVETTEETVEQ